MSKRIVGRRCINYPASLLQNNNVDINKRFSDIDFESSIGLSNDPEIHIYPAYTTCSQLSNW